MAEQSIFHNVVKGEKAYTQLFCNLLRLEELFLRAFLSRIGLQEAIVSPLDIRAEVHLGDHGRADILIKTDKACMIVEIKTEIGRGLEQTQLLTEESEYGYASYLKALKPDSITPRFYFLIPAASYHASDIHEMVQRYEQRFSREGIKTGVILWEQIVYDLRELRLSNEDCSYLDDFRILLEERFGPVVFKDWEVKMLSDSSFVETLVRYVSLMEDLRKQVGDTTFKLQIQKDELGFANRKGTFWCGFWAKYWKEHPCLLFGVAETSDRVKDAFVTSLKEAFGQPVISISDEHEWSCGYFPVEDLIQADGFEKNKQKLQSVWKALSEAGI